MSNPLEPRPDERIKDLESRVAALEECVALLAQGYSRMRHQRRRFWLRPPLWTFEQYTPRPLAENQGHQTDDLPPHPASIAIVTPSFNQCRFLPKTIESVLSQGYPNLIYRVQDAASTDGSVDVLRSYGSRMQWASEPDHGQAQAINRGFAQCRGEIMGYLNSDDALLPGTLTYVASMFAKYPEVDLVYGHRVFIDRSDLEIGRAILPRHSSKALYWADFVPQETLFWRSRVWDEIGPFDENLHFALDWDFLLRAQHSGFKLLRLPRFLACFRVHDEQKTSKIYDKGYEEMQQLRHKYLGYVPSRIKLIQKMMPYLMCQFLYHWGYRFGLLRY